MYHCSPPHLVLCLLFTDTHLLHILLYIVIPPPPWPPSCPLPWYFNFYHSSAYVAFFPSLYMPKPSQSLSPQLLPNSSDLCHTPDVLILHPVLQCHSQCPSHHLQFSCLHFFTILSVTTTVSIPYNTASLTAHL